MRERERQREGGGRGRELKMHKCAYKEITQQRQKIETHREGGGGGESGERDVDKEGVRTEPHCLL